MDIVMTTDNEFKGKIDFLTLHPDKIAQITSDYVGKNRGASKTIMENISKNIL